jgi:SAM-dependent methyltransferase
MTDTNEHDIYVTAWHGNEPYDAKEAVRLERACELFITHADSLALDRRYRLLDIGCGVGPLRHWLPAERFEIVGLELSEQAAELARTNYDDCTVGDAERPWPVEAGSFDGVHAGAIMEHVVNWHKPLNHANVALAEGGQLVISTPNLRYWKEIKRLIKGRQPHWIKHMGHLHGYTPKFLKQLVSLHGFNVTGLQADRVNLPLLKWCDRTMARWFASIGSVMILTALQTRRVRIEHEDLAHMFPDSKPVGMGGIEVLDG